MDRTEIDLRKIATDFAMTARVEARLAGELEESQSPLWGQEFAASGGKAPTPPPESTSA